MLLRYKIQYFEKFRPHMYYWKDPHRYEKAVAKKEIVFLVVRDKKTNKKYIVIYHLKRDLETNKVLQVDRFFRGDEKWILARKKYKHRGNYCHKIFIL